MLFNGYVKVLHLAYVDYPYLARIYLAFGIEKCLEQSPQYILMQYAMQCENFLLIIF